MGWKSTFTVGVTALSAIALAPSAARTPAAAAESPAAAATARSWIYEFCDAQGGTALAASSRAEYEADRAACRQENGEWLATDNGRADYGRYTRDYYVYTNGSAALKTLPLPESAYAHTCAGTTRAHRLVATYSEGRWNTMNRWSMDWWNHLLRIGKSVQAAGHRGLSMDYVGYTYALPERNSGKAPCNPKTGKPFTELQATEAARAMLGYLRSHGVHVLANSVITPADCGPPIRGCDVPADYVRAEQGGYRHDSPTQITNAEAAGVVRFLSVPNAVWMTRAGDSASSCAAWSRYAATLGVMGRHPGRVAVRCDAKDKGDPTGVGPLREYVQRAQRLGTPLAPASVGRCAITRSFAHGKAVFVPRGCPTYRLTVSGRATTLTGTATGAISVRAGSGEIAVTG